MKPDVGHLIKGLEDVVKDLPTYYKSINEWWVDFWQDFSWNREESNKEIETLLKDERFKALEEPFKKCYNQSLKETFEKAIKEKNELHRTKEGRMKTEEQIRKVIKNLTKRYQHVLDCGPATIQVNSPRALMQLSATSMLDALYYVLGEKRPKFECDDTSKTDV